MLRIIIFNLQMSGPTFMGRDGDEIVENYLEKEEFEKALEKYCKAVKTPRQKPIKEFQETRVKNGESQILHMSVDEYKNSLSGDSYEERQIKAFLRVNRDCIKDDKLRDVVEIWKPAKKGYPQHNKEEYDFFTKIEDTGQISVTSLKRLRRAARLPAFSQGLLAVSLKEEEIKKLDLPDLRGVIRTFRELWQKELQRRHAESLQTKRKRSTSLRKRRDFSGYNAVKGRISKDTHSGMSEYERLEQRSGHASGRAIAPTLAAENKAPEPTSSTLHGLPSTTGHPDPEILPTETQPQSESGTAVRVTLGSETASHAQNAPPDAAVSEKSRRNSPDASGYSDIISGPNESGGSRQKKPKLKNIDTISKISSEMGENSVVAESKGERHDTFKIPKIAGEALSREGAKVKLVSNQSYSQSLQDEVKKPTYKMLLRCTFDNPRKNINESIDLDKIAFESLRGNKNFTWKNELDHWDTEEFVCTSNLRVQVNNGSASLVPVPIQERSAPRMSSPGR